MSPPKTKRLSISKILVIFIVGLLLVVVALFLSFVYIEPFVKGLPYRRVAGSIPKYPNAETWEATSRCTLIQTGSCGGFVYFKSTDNIGNVISFYEKELQKDDWKVFSKGDLVLVVHKDNYSMQLSYREGLFKDANYYWSVSKLF